MHVRFYKLVTFALLVIQLRSSFSFSLKRTLTLQKIRARQFSLPASTLVNGDIRRLSDRYSQSTVVSLAIVAVELLSCLHLQSASPFVGTILPVYSAALFSSKVLSDAAERNRLDATTFRLLNFGIILDAVQTVSSTLPITVAIARSSSYLKSVFGLLCLYHAYLTASTSYSALSNFGIPVIKFGVAGPLSAAYLFLAASNFFLPPQVYSCSFLITAIFLAQNGASTAGPKRLSSVTYKTLNGAIIFNSLVKLYGLSAFWPKAISSKAMLHSFFVYFFPVFSLFTALTGLLLGISYRERIDT